MGRFDYFAADLECRRCGHVTPGEFIDMPAYVRAEPSSENLRVGDRCDVLPPDKINYVVLHRPSNDTVRIVEAWTCQACSYWPNWAEIVITDSVIRSIDPVEIDHPLLARVNYITEDAEPVIHEVTGKSYAELRGRTVDVSTITDEARALSQSGRLHELDAAAVLAAEPLLSDEERAFLSEVRIWLRSRRPFSEAQVDRLHLIAQHLP